MRQARIMMGMPIAVEMRGNESRLEFFDEVFSYFNYVDQKFSTYKNTSEISAINRGELDAGSQSNDMKEVFALSEETKRLTGGYFDITKLNGKIDPSGLVKGWAIFNAANILRSHGVKNFYIEAGGDIEASGFNAEDKPWRIGIENPFRKDGETKTEIVKTIDLSDRGIATSGTYKRGRHIYNPISRSLADDNIVSLTVVGPNVYEADRFATAAFAMGRDGIVFIEKLPGFEGYQIDKNGLAVMTSGFINYI